MSAPYREFSIALPGKKTPDAPLFVTAPEDDVPAAYREFSIALPG